MIKTNGLIILTVLLSLAVLSSGVRHYQTTGHENHSKYDDLLAIDVLLEPGPAVAKEAHKANAGLLKNYPQGFALDESHKPHITLAQRYIRAADLPAVTTVISKLFSEARLQELKLKAQGYHTNAKSGIGFCVMAISVTPALAKLQQDVVDALQPYSIPGGTAAAFVQNENRIPIDSITVNYVNRFVPDYSGEKFSPHISIGFANADYLQQLMKSSFKVITFTPAAAAIYHLGDFGTARKELWRSKSAK